MNGNFNIMDALNLMQKMNGNQPQNNPQYGYSSPNDMANSMLANNPNLQQLQQLQMLMNMQNNQQNSPFNGNSFNNASYGNSQPMQQPQPMQGGYYNSSPMQNVNNAVNNSTYQNTQQQNNAVNNHTNATSNSATNNHESTQKTTALNERTAVVFNGLSPIAKFGSKDIIYSLTRYFSR